MEHERFHASDGNCDMPRNNCSKRNSHTLDWTTASRQVSVYGNKSFTHSKWPFLTTTTERKAANSIKQQSLYTDLQQHTRFESNLNILEQETPRVQVTPSRNANIWLIFFLLLPGTEKNSSKVRPCPCTLRCGFIKLTDDRSRRMFDQAETHWTLLWTTSHHSKSFQI